MYRIGLGLSGFGVKKGDRVCIYLESSPEYLIRYFAIWRIGAVAVPTNIVYRCIIKNPDTGQQTP
jgi:long-chain acyl-CoA synthetase